MKIPIGKHGNITQTMPNDTSARARRARSSYKFKNATSPWREWRYPMKNPMNRKYFWLPGSVEGGRRSLPSLGRSQWSASSKRGETARPKRSKLPKMGALARMAVKRTKTVSKPPHRAPRVRGASGHPPHPFSAKVVMERENPIFGPLVAPLSPEGRLNIPPFPHGRSMIHGRLVRYMAFAGVFVAGYRVTRSAKNAVFSNKIVKYIRMY